MEPYFHSIAPGSLTGAELDQLLALGWYRMHQTLFTTSHIKREAWHRVHWLRFPVAEIGTRASHQRIRKKISGFRVVVEPGHPVVPAHEMLYQTYYQSIDFAGATSVAECLFGEEPPDATIFTTRCVCVYDDQKLIAAGYLDVGHRAAASILHFYDPAYRAYSLGKALILLTLDYVRSLGVHYYYPGYVVEHDPKMNYKLFLGIDAAAYFDPESMQWKPLRALPDFGRHFARAR